MRSRGLKPKHLKALKLLSENKSVDEVSKLSGIGRRQLFGLVAGDEHQSGPVAHEFSEEYRKEIDELTKKTETKVKKLKDQIITIFGQWLVANIPDPKHIPEKDKKFTIDVLNALTKATPQINIGSLSYSKGLVGEDLANEFRRLTALARTAFDRGAVQPAESGEQGLLPPSSGTGNTTEEDQKASDVRPEPEAGTLS